MELKLPVQIDWDLAEDTYAEARLLFQAGIRRSVESVVDGSDLGHVAYVDMARDHVVIFIRNPDLGEAERLWKTDSQRFLLQMIADRVSRAADAYLRSLGMGGVEGCMPSYSQFGNYQRCSEEPTDPSSYPPCEVAPKIPLGDLDEGEKTVGDVIENIRMWVEDYRAGYPPRQYHIDQICERLDDLLTAWNASEESQPLFFHLYNGWDEPEECAKVCDFGEDGPVLGPFNHVQLTYGGHMKMVQCGDMKDPMTDLNVGEFTYYDGMWYGDIFVFTQDEEEATTSDGFERWDPEKAHPSRRQMEKAGQKASHMGERNPDEAQPPEWEWLGEGILRDLSENDRQEVENLAIDLKDTKLECAPHGTWVAIAQMCLGKAQMLNAGAYGMDDGHDDEMIDWIDQLHRIGCTILEHTNLNRKENTENSLGK